MKESKESTSEAVSEIKEDFKLKIEINKWEQKTNKSTGKLEVVFNIELSSEITNKKWNVYHSIQDFKELITNLSSICIKIPEYPDLKTIEKEKSSSLIINKASSAINEFLNHSYYRSDIFNSQLFIDFFQLENHLEDLKKYEPKEKSHITNLKHEVSDIILLEKLDVLIVGCAHDPNQNLISKINFWSKKDKNGQLNVYKINNNQENYILYAQADTDSEISCLYFCEESKNILVGYFNGTIDVFDFPDFPEILQNPLNLVSKNKIEVNNKKNRIINLGYNSIDNLFYTACYKDIMISAGKITDTKIEFSLPGSEDDLIGFYYIDDYNNLFKDLVIEMDIKGKIYIGTVDKENKALSLLFVYTEQMTLASLFKVSFEYNHIYIGDKEGNLDVISFDIQKDKTKVTKLLNTSLSMNSKNTISNMITRSFPYRINDIWYNPKRKEILVGLSNGTIQIFSHFKNFAEYVIYEPEPGKEKDNKSITKMYFSKLNLILYAGRIEKDIYVYQMPENYNSEMSRRLPDTNSFEILNGSKLCKNAIDKGYTNTTQSFKKKSLMTMIRKK
jgi:hypothetical protein